MRCFEHIAKLIKTKRMAHPKGMSQSELSNLLGYKNGQFISNVERALCNIPFKMLKKVSEILDIPTDELKIAILKDHEITLNNYLSGNCDQTVRPRRRGGQESAGEEREAMAVVTPISSAVETPSRTIVSDDMQDDDMKQAA